MSGSQARLLQQAPAFTAGVAQGSGGGIKVRHKTKHAIMRALAVAAADGKRGGVGTAICQFGGWCQRISADDF